MLHELLVEGDAEPGPVRNRDPAVWIGLHTFVRECVPQRRIIDTILEQEGIAAQVLLNLGLKLEDVREEVLNLLGDNTPTSPAHVVVDALSEVLNAPAHPTAEQLQLIHDRIKRLNEQKEVFVMEQDFVLAARCRDEAEALTRLLSWYAWAQSR